MPASPPAPDSTRTASRGAPLDGCDGLRGHGHPIITERRRVSLATLYHYMSSKEDLLVGMMREYILTLLRDAEKALVGRRKPAERIAALVTAHVTIHATQSLLCVVCDTELRSLTPEHRAEVVMYRDRYERLWREAIDQGVAAGDFRIADTAIASGALLEMCTGVAHWYRPGGRLSLDDVIGVYVEDMALGLLSGSNHRRIRSTRASS